MNGTLQAAIDKINALPTAPDFLIHTGDLTHLSNRRSSTRWAKCCSGSKTKQAFYVPGEHDNSVDDGKLYLERYGKGYQGNRLV